MSVRDLLAKKMNVSNAAAGLQPALPPTPVAAPAAAPTPTPAPVQQAAPTPAPAVQTPAAPVASTPTASAEGCVAPPWAVPGCKACSGKGFNNSGNPCRICDNAHKTDGKASKEFVIEPSGDGKVLWVARDGSCEGESFIGGTAPAPVVTQVREAAPVVQQQTTPPPAPVEQPAAVPANVPPVVATPAAVAAAVTQSPEAETKEKGKKGRPERSFTLVRNGSVAKGAERIGSGRGVIRLDDLLQKYGSELAKVSGVGSYYELDAFKRRDNLASVANVIAEEIGTDIVVCSGIGTGASDLKALYDALKPYAGMEIICEQN